jgi:hypothetical protein
MGLRRVSLFVITTLMLLAPSVRAITINGRCYPQPVFLGVGDRQTDLAIRANIGWIRTTFVWREIEPGPNQWAWSDPNNFYDSMVNYYNAHGLKVLAILSTAPVWAGSNNTGTVPPDIALWQTFVQQVAAHFAGRVAAYEIWNEPDLTNSSTQGVGWDGPLNSPPAYADYVRVAAQAIRANAPGTLVVAPVMSGTGARSGDVWRSLENYQMQGGTASQYIDVVSFHENAHNEPPSTVWSWVTNQMASIATNNPSNLNKPIWITEFGWPSGSVGEQYQANDIKYVVQQMTRWICGTCYPTYCDYHNFPKYSVAFIYKNIDDPRSSQGIFHQDGTPKPVVTEYTTTLPQVGIQPPASASYTDLYIPSSMSCVGRTCTFTSGYPDQSTSGLQETFDWDFGDGTTGVGRSITHTYAQGGTFFVFHGTWWITHVYTDAKILRVP